MRNLFVVALALASAAAIRAVGHTGGPEQQPPIQEPKVTLAQADPAPTAGYDPLARQGAPQPVNPMLPGPSGPSEDAQEDVALNPELGNLPDTPGVEETFYLCTACHSAAIIKQQRLPAERWDYLWNWMIEEQGMPEQDPETRATILSYLKRHFSWSE